MQKPYTILHKLPGRAKKGGPADWPRLRVPKVAGYAALARCGVRFARGRLALQLKHGFATGIASSCKAGIAVSLTAAAGFLHRASLQLYGGVMASLTAAG